MGSVFEKDKKAVAVMETFFHLVSANFNLFLYCDGKIKCTDRLRPSLVFLCKVCTNTLKILQTQKGTFFLLEKCIYTGMLATSNGAGSYTWT